MDTAERLSQHLLLRLHQLHKHEQAARITSETETCVKKISEERHPGLEQIRRFVRGEASPAENRELVRHLLHGCPEFQKLVRAYWSEEDSDPSRPRELLFSESAAAARTELYKGDAYAMKKQPVRKLSLSKETVLSLDNLRAVQGAYRPSADAYCRWATIWTDGCIIQV